ncbi:hypothetical protein [Longirhabdus pacifica]|uniref:hypothetical protein n=1 Tax=Longirhabdus pacifica TaxID=2305227 RepID=UPI001009388B|nr:hypothetical protein [Longirhabdus pacifica]
MKKYKWFKSQQGSFTLESTLAFPVIIMFVVLLLGLTTASYDHVKLIFYSQTSVERAAYIWDNEQRDIETGAYGMKPKTMGAFYWRWTDDKAYNIFLGFNNPSVTVDIPAGESNSDDRATMKLTKAIQDLPADEAYSGSLSYSNYILERRVDGKLEQEVNSPFINQVSILGETEVVLGEEAKSWIIEPTEFIRTVDFIVTYAKAYKDNYAKDGEDTLNKSTATEAINEFLDMDEQQDEEEKPYKKLKDHGAAVIELKKMVNGKKSSIETSYGERDIDALDTDGVMHHALSSWTNSSLEDQLVKDIELVSEGEVVVWHFFETKKTIKLEPTGEMRQRIIDAGITIVVHKEVEHEEEE